MSKDGYIITDEDAEALGWTQPSGQTGREILRQFHKLEYGTITHYKDGLIDFAHADAHVEENMIKAEAAINAHIVSVLEKLRTNAYWSNEDGEVLEAANIDIAIENYKQIDKELEKL